MKTKIPSPKSQAQNPKGCFLKIETWNLGLGAFLLLLPLVPGTLLAQRVAINSSGALPNPSALLDVDATPTNDKGILIPRVSLTDVTVYLPITGTPITSLLVYSNTSPTGGGGVGYYYWDGTKWAQLGGTAATGNDWLLLGNIGTVDGVNFLGTTDNVPLSFRVNNNKAGRIDHILFNTFFGYQAGNANTTGSQNTAIGVDALFSNTTLSNLVAIGDSALFNNGVGATGLAATANTAVGSKALYSNTTGMNHTAIGYQALYSNISGIGNTAIGYQALYFNMGTFIPPNGSANTAIGWHALYSNTTGRQNTANGEIALVANTTGNWNTANGAWALADNTTGLSNAATGYAALLRNTTGSWNTACGQSSLPYNTTGSYNTANGMYALYSNTTGTENTAIGYSAGYGAASGVNFNKCTFIGSASYPTVSRTNVTMLGYGITNAQCTGDNQVLLGNTSVTDLRAAVTGITVYSDARFKTNVKDNVVGLDFILKLKPVTYNVRLKELHKIWGTPDSLVNKTDHSEAAQKTRIGFVAQEVEKAAKESGFNFPGIDVPKNDKEVYTLRYVDFIMPAVKAIQELKAENDSLSKGYEELLRILLSEQTENKTLNIQIEELKSENASMKSDIEKIKTQLGTEVKK